MNLPLELLYEIINLVIEADVEPCQDILKWSSSIATVELLLVNHSIYNYIVQNASFHRLRLWKLLTWIPRQYEPIQLAVGISDTQFTILRVDVRNERIDAKQYENFLVLEEAIKPKKWIKMDYLYVQHQQEHTKTSSRRVTVVPFFQLDTFLQDLKLFTTQNLMSIWLWKRSNSFFKKDVHVNHYFKPILDTQQRSLMAWDRPIAAENGTSLIKKKSRGLTESVMLYNTELFGRLL